MHKRSSWEPRLYQKLSLCGLTGKGSLSFSNINLIFVLFHLTVPPESHIFSTWQNLNLSADGALYCFLWLHRRGRLRLMADVSCFDPFSGPSTLPPNTLSLTQNPLTKATYINYLYLNSDGHGFGGPLGHIWLFSLWAWPQRDTKSQIIISNLSFELAVQD